MISAPRRVTSQKSGSATVAAPVGGWNARDAIGAMHKLDAVQLTNWWPGTNSVILRHGYSEHSTDIVGQVETLMVYNSGTATYLLAAAETVIYDATTAGAAEGPATSTKARAGIASPRLQYVNFTTTGGSYLVCVNGEEKQLVFDGSAWHQDGEGAPYDVTGLDTADCDNIVAFKNRLWLIEKNTLKAWYLPINAIGGAANALNMSSVFFKGGYLVAGMTWTLDAGYGMDDYLAFITSQGEVAVWRLTDPTSPSGIALIGVFTVGAPVGRRCYIKYGGDLLILTQDGVIPMSRGLLSSRTDPHVGITDKIRFAVAQAITLYGSHFGWQLFFFPKENQLFINVPVEEGDIQQQYVQNNITKSWCNFTGWAANCWELMNDEPYFGGNGFVGKAWDGTDDNGADISALCIQSFQQYGGARQKQCKMIRAHFLTSGSPAVYGNVNTDYDLSDNSAPLNASPPTYGLWDVGLWDSALWGADLVPSAEWQGATGIGWTFAPFIKVATSGIHLQWLATDMVFEQGGIL